MNFNFGNRLTTWMHAKNIKPSDLAERTNMSAPTIYGYMSHRLPKIDWILDAVKAMELSKEDATEFVLGPAFNETEPGDAEPSKVCDKDCETVCEECETEQTTALTPAATVPETA